VLLLEGLTVQVAGGAWLSSPGKHTWGTQPSSLCCPGLLPTPLSIIACALQSPLMVQAELETPGSWRKDQLGQRHSLVPLGCEPAACPWSPPLTVVLRSTFCELLEVSQSCLCPRTCGWCPCCRRQGNGYDVPMLAQSSQWPPHPQQPWMCCGSLVDLHCSPGAKWFPQREAALRC